MTARWSRAAIALAAAAAGCGSAGGAEPGDGGPDGLVCSVSIETAPAEPVAGPAEIVRAVAVVGGAPGVLGYSWLVSHDDVAVPATPAQIDSSEIEFPTATTGVYRVQLDVTAPGQACASALVEVNVGARDANLLDLRLHVTPPATTAAPPIDRLVQVRGGADFSLGTVALDPGVAATVTVRAAGAGVPAYVKLMPAAGRDGFVEAFAGADGRFTARVLNQPHDVLVVPVPAGLAPRLIPGWTPAQTTITVDAGASITGVVRDPANAALAGAKVQVTVEVASGGEVIAVPSTLATTSATGAFTLAAVPVAGARVRVDVTPPAASGLPRLTASSTQLDLGAEITVRYAAGLVTRDLANTTLRRQTAALPNGELVVVGAIAAAGTVEAGATATATGEVRIAATADGAGRLPSLRAPAAALTAVVAPAAGDVALSALDLTAGVPASIDAPAMQTVALTVEQAGSQSGQPGQPGAPLDGVIVEAVPLGELALAGAPPVRARSAIGGGLSPRLAAGGRYQLRFSDPAGRGAPLVADFTVTASPTRFALPPRLRLTGAVRLGGNAAVAGASIQILCAACAGIERSRPLAEAATAANGTFQIAVPDPGQASP